MTATFPPARVDQFQAAERITFTPPRPPKEVARLVTFFSPVKSRVRRHHSSSCESYPLRFRRTSHLYSREVWGPLGRFAELRLILDTGSAETILSPHTLDEIGYSARHGEETAITGRWLDKNAATPFA